MMEMGLMDLYDESYLGFHGMNLEILWIWRNTRV